MTETAKTPSHPVDPERTNADACSANATRRYGIHLSALSATKIADGLIDPKLVLAWLMSALGAPGYLIGALVPVREAGALLPQLALARWIQAHEQRKWFWASGALVQGLAALGIAASALALDGATAGWAILVCLTVLACARAACSSSHKDLLARTMAKGKRGTVSGLAGTVGSLAVFGFAMLLSFGVLPLTVGHISGAVALAGVLWMIAAIIFSRLDEPPAKPKLVGDALAEMVAPLKQDAELRQYLVTRAALISTALAPPFLVMLIGTTQDARIGTLGLLILSSAMASILSSYLWGWLSDKSSRQTLVFSGALATLALGTAASVGIVTGNLGQIWVGPLLLFLAQIAYEGTRAGRKTHLTDMDTDGQRPLYTALSNSLIGVLLLVGGAFGLLADIAGPEWTLPALASMAAVGALAALRLSEVQQA